MKILSLTLAFMLVATQCQAGWWVTMMPTVASSVESCGTNNLLLALHFENSDTITSGTPAGCVVSGGDTSLTRTGVTYSSTEKSDGTYSAYSTAENSSGALDNTNLSDADETGTYCADVYYSRAGNTVLFELGAGRGEMIYGAGNTSTLTAKYGSASFLGTDTITSSSWTRLCVSWDVTPTAGSQKLATKVGANTWEESTTINVTAGTLASTIYPIGATWNYFPGYVDNVKLYSDYQHAE